ncbi:hypothetical protein, partial [Vibrio nigripulchritudo]|uniref:hypothetical protein n=1 Tax=Vibrio nigripulchritudo TaxID=28173 RepID=UPI0007E512EC
SLVVLLFLFVIGRKVYESIPTGFEKRAAEGPHVFLSLLEDGKYTKGLNSDPYISSAYRPEDKLYEPLLAVQQGRWDEAQELLEPLAMAGDATAMFWLAEISYSSDAFSGTYGATLFKKAAKLGNPYAALKLDSDNKECKRFMAKHCSKKWGDLGEKLLEERVVNGDFKARYALSRYRGWETKKDYLETVNVAIESAKNNYFEPIKSIAFSYYDRSIKENRELEKELLKFLLYNNYPPALVSLYFGDYSYSKEYLDLIYSKYQLIVGHKARTIMDFYRDYYKNDREKMILSLAVSMLSDSYKSEFDGKYGISKFEFVYLEPDPHHQFWTPS